MSLLILDNYDSFTYNLFHLLEPLDEQIVVARNDEIELEQVSDFERIVLSPGPGLPGEAGIMPALIERYASTKKILGVCLGMQAIAEHFGLGLTNMEQPRHGRSIRIDIESDTELFQGIGNEMVVGLYHSWAVQGEASHSEIAFLAHSEEGWPMALKHRTLSIHGIQFHPESVMTPRGDELIRNWYSL